MLRYTTNKFFLRVPAEAFTRSGMKRVNTGPTNSLDSWMQMPIRNVLQFEPVYELSYDAFPDYSYQAFQGVKVDQKTSKLMRIRAHVRISKYYGFDPWVCADKTDQRVRDHLDTVAPTLEEEIPENFK